MRKRTNERGPRRNFEYKRNQPNPHLGPRGVPRRIEPYPPKPQREDIKVTVDTVIPPIPGKAELVGKPNWETEYKKEFDRLGEEIKKLKNEKVKRI